MKLEYIEVNPITRRQLEDLWDIRAAQTLNEFAIAVVRVASETRYPIDVLHALLEGTSPTTAWRLFRKMTRADLADVAGVSHTGLSSIEQGLSSGNQLRDKLATALAVAPEALIAP